MHGNIHAAFDEDSAGAGPVLDLVRAARHGTHRARVQIHLQLHAGDRGRLDLLVDHGVRTFVDLTTPADGLAPYDLPLASIAAARGLAVQRVAHPIPDLGVVERAGYDAILATIAAADVAYVHCWGGIGRTGTVVGCHLVDGGLTATAALGEIATLRAGTRKADRPSPETEPQREVVRGR